ncbi:MAG: thioesterase family protein [Ardenticatenaceae bacterium]|nr:thioesterase family protein [Ardenticatenaceae bacterium]
MTQLETYRGFVYPWHIDHIGHMNVQFYVARFDEASWHFLAHYGITPSYLKENQRGMAAAEQTIKYQKEVLAGSLLVIRTELVAVRPKVLKYRHVMFDGATNEQVAEMLLTAIHIDTTLRKSCPLPPDILKKFEADL